jgi:hypothetical protein
MTMPVKAFQCYLGDVAAFAIVAIVFVIVKSGLNQI